MLSAEAEGRPDEKLFPPRHNSVTKERFPKVIERIGINCASERDQCLENVDYYDVQSSIYTGSTPTHGAIIRMFSSHVTITTIVVV